MRMGVDILAKTITVTVPAYGPGTSDRTESYAVDPLPTVPKGVIRIGWNDDEPHLPEEGGEAIKGKGAIVRAGEGEGEEIHETFLDRERILPFMAAFETARSRALSAAALESAADTTRPIQVQQFR